MDAVWIRHELPWVREGIVHVAHLSEHGRLRRDLTNLDFEIVELQGHRMTDIPAVWGEIVRAFGFPEWCGHNWDAFNECFGDRFPEASGRLAIVWMHPEVPANRTLVTFAEAVHMFLHRGFELYRLWDGTNDLFQVELFFVSDDDSLPRPS